ncbi:hypothetical protein AVEN_59715-1 [Araneus ventricosus]|uniref:Uncharacterized protein n=1 Tax=Araneus ventricosus TaxID=182803 RepID=A0A4Y2BN87_ARAVE|nr:hypothetical protein AVEN_59715-1 [Araneus ventricosus]
MMRTIPELASPSPNFHTRPTGERFTVYRFQEQNAIIYGRSFMEWGLEPALLESRSQDSDKSIANQKLEHLKKKNSGNFVFFSARDILSVIFL